MTCLIGRLKIINNIVIYQMILPNHNAVKRVNREYIEVENINEKTLELLKNEMQNTNIYEKNES